MAVRVAHRLPPTLAAALLAVGAAVVVCVPAASRGGEFHRNIQLVCSDCHTMHGSIGGSPTRFDLATDPGPSLLRHSSATALCLHCHGDGSQNAPDVVAPVSYVGDPLGGFFENVGDPSANGHDLATQDPVTPPDGTMAVTLGCTSCHDPHGSDSYRNLRLDPGRTGASLPVTVQQTVVANGTNRTSVYVQGNVTYKSGITAWCLGCHNLYDDTVAHASDVTLRTSWMVDYAFWLLPKTNRVRVQSPTDNVVPSDDDQVFCLTCHKAHGSSNPFAQIFADGLSQESTCNQCHNQ